MNLSDFLMLSVVLCVIACALLYWSHHRNEKAAEIVKAAEADAAAAGRAAVAALHSIAVKLTEKLHQSAPVVPDSQPTPIPPAAADPAAPATSFPPGPAGPIAVE